MNQFSMVILFSMNNNNRHLRNKCDVLKITNSSKNDIKMNEDPNNTFLLIRQNSIILKLFL